MLSTNQVALGSSKVIKHEFCKSKNGLSLPLEVIDVFRPLIKVLFLGRAAFEVGREKVEDMFDSVTARAGEVKSKETDRVEEAKEKIKEVVGEVSQHIWQRSEVIENQVKEKIRRQVADFSLGALGDTTEINELRAELATLRAEIADLKSSKSLV